MLSYAVISKKALLVCRYLVIVTAISAPISTAAASIASIGLLLAWLLSGQAAHSLKISFRHPLGKIILLFVAWLLVGCLYADTGWPAKLATLMSWNKLFFVFILLGLFDQQHWQQRFVIAYIGFMAAASVVAIPLWALDLIVRSGREPGIFMTNYSTQSMAFIAALLCCLFLAKDVRLAGRRQYLWAAMALFLFNILIISPARSGYLALLPALAFAGVVLYGFKRLPLVLGAVFGILLIAAFSSSTLQQRFKQGLAEQNSYQSSDKLTSIGIRMVFYTNTLELIKARPIFGYGTSSFKNTYTDLVSSKYRDWRSQSTTDPHNQYLFIWLENGLIGVLLFLAYIWTAIRQGLRNPPYGPIAASFLVAICATSLFNSHFKTFAEGNLLAFFLGALLARDSVAQNLNTDHA
ncbi:MAG: O-antigen ligase family protein [Methylococcales bacterium]|nr:O-antigen ligase family protein [Methylococcales bacterium]